MEATPCARYDGGNHIIDGLPPADRAEIVRHLTMMTADDASSGNSRGEAITAAYFPVDTVFSVLVELNGGDCYEADTVGREGLIGGEVLFGADVAPRSVICQLAGQFAQMPVAAFERCLAQTPSFAAAVRRALLMQWYRAQQTIACNFAHTLVERCARWTLLTQDAIGRPVFPLRAEYLSMVLGVQTHVVTEPMSVLEAIGAIRYRDDAVSIASDSGLRDAACECYTAPLDYAQRITVRRPREREAQ